jgi:hypothetical protein
MYGNIYILVRYIAVKYIIVVVNAGGKRIYD